MKQGAALGEAYLFFGCRKSTSDFIYQHELADFRKDKSLTDAFIAFSREGKEKVYVQDLLRQRRQLVEEVIREKGGHFYICGNTKMGHDVQQVLKDFLGEEFVKELERDKKLIKELWG